MLSPMNLHSKLEAGLPVRRHLDSLRRCTLCPRMHGPVVVGHPVASRVILIGQAPGDKEPKFGRPFGE
jgi:uracil-DNA glycosylase